MNYHLLKPPKLLSKDFFFAQEWEAEFQKFRMKDVPRLTRIIVTQTISIIVIATILLFIFGPYPHGFVETFLGHMSIMIALSVGHYLTSFFILTKPRLSQLVILSGSCLYIVVIVSTIKLFPVVYHSIAFNIFLIVIVGNYLNLPLRLEQHLFLGLFTFSTLIWTGLAGSMITKETELARSAIYVYGYSVNAIGLMVAYFIEFYFRKSFYSEQMVVMEQKRVDALIQNILPAPVAERLKAGEATIAEDYPSVTVVFADIVGFTEMSTQLRAGQVVSHLNEIFSKFDEIALRHGIEKIKTIGDCFMAAGGVPQESTDHADRVVAAAFDMLRVIDEFRRPDGTPMQLRIGVHSGPVTAGVIGIHRFIYDLWGDTVNIASRLESTAPYGSIVISHATYQTLGPDLRRHFKDVETADIRGRGKVDVHLQKRA